MARSKAIRVVMAATLVLSSVGCGSEGSITAPPLPPVELSGSQELFGQVMEESLRGDRPSRFAQVRAVGEGIARSAVTDANGDYILEGLPAGRVRVVVQKPGYVTEDTAIDLQDQHELNFRLRRAKRSHDSQGPQLVVEETAGDGGTGLEASAIELRPE
jgi:hypothetical protein